MNIEEIREYCIGKPGVSEGFPFDETTLVFKVMGKMFALLNLDGELRINLKCDPEEAISLREQYSCVIPGFHMNKKHWNSIIISDIPTAKLFLSWIDDSYELVKNSLTKKLRSELEKFS